MDKPTRSEILDQLVTSYLKLPVRLFWDGGPLTPFFSGGGDTFDGVRLECDGIATAWLNLQHVVLHARQVKVIPGLPVRIEVIDPRVEIAVGQAELDRWIKQFEIPFRLELAEGGLIVHTEVAGFPVAEFETQLEVVGGWFVLKPQKASFLGMPSYVSSFFRTYLPLPALSEETRLTAIEHEPGLLKLTFSTDDFEEEITPGLLVRMQRRLLPLFGKISESGRSTYGRD